MNAPALTAVERRGCYLVSLNLRDFGYPVSAAEIEEAFRRWRAGEPPADIVARFACDQFSDHPEFFGERP